MAKQHSPTSEGDHHEGLSGDLRVLVSRMNRRRVLGLFAVTTLLQAVGCGDDGSTTNGGGGSGGSGGSGGGTTTTGDGTCSAIPEETAGPYPGDGTNGANALTLTGIVRSDITSSIAGATGVAEGIALTVTLTVVDASGCAPLAGHAVYLWHCDRDGNYSMYSAAVADENYLRGVQETDSEGKVTFKTIFPACYSGRWPHIHFEVYDSLAEATSGNNKMATSQLALPESTCKEAYATTGYESSVSNLAAVSLSTDNVFGDGATLQLAAITGAAAAGYTATLTVAI